MSQMAGPRCSVVILTHDECINIAGVLRSAAGFSDVHVIDSGSTDGTVECARQMGAKVWHNPFKSFGQQRNWAHDHAGLQFDWVLHLDADERLSDQLVEEIRAAIDSDDGKRAGYYLAEKTILNGKWLRRAGQYPRYQARLVHRGRMKFVDHGHGQRESSGLPFGTLHTPYEHLAFSHGLDRWLRKHAAYASREAQVIRSERRSLGEVARDVLRGDRNQKRRALKYLAKHAPFRPTLRWIHILLISGGVLDGWVGFKYARMMWLFQHMIDLLVANPDDGNHPAEETKKA